MSQNVNLILTVDLARKVTRLEFRREVLTLAAMKPVKFAGARRQAQTIPSAKRLLPGPTQNDTDATTVDMDEAVGAEIFD